MLKTKILKLRKSGLTYSQIAKKLKCSKGTISYYLGEGQKERNISRQRIRRSKQHPYVRKIQNFNRNRENKPLSTPKSKVDKLLYTKMWKFCMRKAPSFTLQDIINKFGEKPKCYLTGQTIDIYDTKSYEFDHIIPVSRGGANTIDNLGICLTRVNRAKNNMTQEEFICLCKQVVNHNK